MSKDVFYHGTSAMHLQDILRHGVKPVRGLDRLWNDSYPEQTYWWSAKAVAERERVNFEYGKDRALTDACESSATAVALATRDFRAIVIEAVFPSTWAEPDTSGQGMEGAVQVYEKKITSKYIQSIHISPCLSLLRPLLLKAALMNNCFQNHRVSDSDKRFLKYFESDYYPLLTETTTFERYTVSELKSKKYEQRLDVILP